MQLDAMQLDAIVVGGSFAGLSAAIHIARARRSVCVVDAGRPRNRFADASHGFFSRDGAPPLDMIATARSQLARYPGARVIAGEAAEAQILPNGFRVVLAGGEVLEAARLVLAFGVSDVLPELPGLAERWGQSVLHCPYCHGFEFAGRRLGVLQSATFPAEKAALIAEWGPTTLYLDGGSSPDAATLAGLARRGVAVEPAPIAALGGEGTELGFLRMADGRQLGIDALYLAPRTRLNSDIARTLGCAVDEGPFGQVIRTDAVKQTTVPGVFAAGDIARFPGNATWAAADGVTAGVALHHSLVFADLAA